MTLFKTYTKIVFALSFAIVAATVHGEDADEYKQKGIDALKDSQTNPRSIVDAARNFARAAQAYAIAGDEEKAVDMNSYLYWCKKKMSMEDIDAFVKSGEGALVATLNAIAEKKVDANAAQAWFDRADSFAQKSPDEHLLIAIRFYEVADRFKGSEISLQAQDRSLKEQTLAMGQKNAPKTKPVVVTAPAVEDKAETIVKVPVPDAAKVKDAEKELRNILKDEYAKTKPEDKVALAKKLMTMAADATNDPVTKYAEMHEAGDLAVAAGDVALALKVVRKQDAAYILDAMAIRSALLKSILDATKSKDICKAVADAAVLLIDDAIETEQFNALRPLANLGDSAVARAANADLAALMKVKSAGIDEILKEWPAAKAALEKLKTDDKNPALSLVAGKFLCFMKGDMEHGLPLLVNGPDAALKKLAESDLANPSEATQFNTLGDSWWDLAEKEKSKRANLCMLARAGFWYTKAYGGVSGLSKVKLEKRLATITAMAGLSIKITNDLSGKWTVSWTEHSAYGKRTCEFRADGAILVAATENFGLYKPVKWTVKGKQVIIGFKNGESSIYNIVDENTFKQGDGGDATYSRKAKN